MDRRVLGAVADRGIPTMVFDDEALDSGKERHAAEAALKDSKPLTHNAYKVELAKRAIVRALMRASKLA